MEHKQNTAKELLDSCIGLIYLAEQMLKSCQLKKQKVHSHTRYVVSFFFRRSLQMLKSFIILIKENRVVDSMVLLRSLCDMCIDLEYIFAKKETKEINALKFILKGEEDQLKLLENNYDAIKEIDDSIDIQKAKIEKNIKEIREDLTKKYNTSKWGWPPLRNRAEEAGKIILNYYTHVYGNYCNIEHHSLLFGQYYVDWARCEPKENLEELESLFFFKPESLLYLFRGLFLVVLSKFNIEFSLKYTDIILNCLRKHKLESKNLGKSL